MAEGPGVAWFLSPCGLSPQTADSLVVMEGVSDGVTSELRSPRGVEGSSEQTSWVASGKKEGIDL